MNKKWLKYLFFSVAFGSFLRIDSSQAKLFDVEEFYLDNGLQVLVIPNHKAPIVKHMVWYKVGAVNEPVGKGGMAHLLEHLMFRGTKKVKDGEFNKIVTENGADANAFTSLDETAYHEFADLSRLELMMALESDRMQNLNITQEAFDKEQKIVYQERKQVIENNPTAYFGEMMQRNLWQEHPYGRPVTGTPDEILSLTLDDVQAFYDTYYAPNNAVLVIAGDVDSVAARTLAEKYYGNIAPRETLKNIDFPKLENISSTKTLMKSKDINTSRFVRSFVVPSFSQDKHMSYALSVLSAYLGEGETSYLYKRLVKEEQVAVGISTSYDFTAQSYGRFSISAVLSPNVSSQLFEDKLNDAIKDAMKMLTWDELNIVKNKMLSGIVYLKDNPNDAAYIAGGFALAGMNVDEIQNYDANIQAVKFGDVQQAAKLLENSISAQGVLMPAKGD